MALTKTPIELSSTPSIVDGGNATAITIDSSERVGLGTDSPNAILTTDPESGNFSSTYNNYDGVGLFLRGNGTSGNGNYGPALAFGSCDSDTTNQTEKHAAISIVQTGTDPNETGLAFWTHPTATAADALGEKMRISADGSIHVTGPSPAGIYLDSNNTRIYHGTNRLLEGSTDSTAVVTLAESFTGYLYCEPTIRAKRGISFGTDTATANQLDDYEEGTWTPSLAGNNSNSGQSYAAQQGTYTKIGRQVTCRFHLSLNAEGSFGANYIKLIGFPFNIASSPDNTMMGNLYFVNMGANFISVGLQAHDGVNQAYLWGKTSATTSREYVGVSDLSDNTELTGTFTYFV